MVGVLDMTNRSQAERQAIEASLHGPRPGAPPEFQSTNRVLERWAVSIGLGVQSEQWQDLVISRPPPLDEPTAIVVDQLVMKSPHRTKALLFKWYRTNLPREAIARELKISTRNVEPAWHLCLLCMQHRFVESQYPPLLKLLRFKEELGT